ncbi:hypothetical protein CE91St41_26770 [Oscillospiraceae bacterium]|nr:hypothetical protein CE91St40_10770 [Oscillospiraceae bacterium]BDF75788.1 hypothetical protein CE91St41_26770 [Oscillospiraceae bacterium]
MSRANHRHSYTLLCHTPEEMHIKTRQVLWAVAHDQVPGHGTAGTRLWYLYIIYVCLFDPYGDGVLRHDHSWTWRPQKSRWVRMRETVIVVPTSDAGTTYASDDVVQRVSATLLTKNRNAYEDLAK